MNKGHLVKAKKKIFQFYTSIEHCMYFFVQKKKQITYVNVS